MRLGVGGAARHAAWYEYRLGDGATPHVHHRLVGLRCRSVRAAVLDRRCTGARRPQGDGHDGQPAAVAVGGASGELAVEPRLRAQRGALRGADVALAGACGRVDVRHPLERRGREERGARAAVDARGGDGPLGVEERREQLSERGDARPLGRPHVVRHRVVEAARVSHRQQPPRLRRRRLVQPQNGGARAVGAARQAQLRDARERRKVQQRAGGEGGDGRAAQVVDGAPAEPVRAVQRRRAEGGAERLQQTVERGHVGAARAADVVDQGVLVGVPQLAHQRRVVPVGGHDEAEAAPQHVVDELAALLRQKRLLGVDEQQRAILGGVEGAKVAAEHLEVEARAAQSPEERQEVGVRVVAVPVHQLGVALRQIVVGEEAVRVVGRVAHVKQQAAVARRHRHHAHAHRHPHHALAASLTVGLAVGLTVGRAVGVSANVAAMSLHRRLRLPQQLGRSASRRLGGRPGRGGGGSGGGGGGTSNVRWRPVAQHNLDLAAHVARPRLRRLRRSDAHAEPSAPREDLLRIREGDLDHPCRARLGIAWQPARRPRKVRRDGARVEERQIEHERLCAAEERLGAHRPVEAATAGEVDRRRQCRDVRRKVSHQPRGRVWPEEAHALLHVRVATHPLGALDEHLLDRRRVEQLPPTRRRKLRQKQRQHAHHHRARHRRPPLVLAASTRRLAPELAVRHQVDAAAPVAVRDLPQRHPARRPAREMAALVEPSDAHHRRVVRRVEQRAPPRPRVAAAADDRDPGRRQLAHFGDERRVAKVGPAHAEADDVDLLPQRVVEAGEEPRGRARLRRVEDAHKVELRVRREAAAVLARRDHASHERRVADVVLGRLLLAKVDGLRDVPHPVVHRRQARVEDGDAHASALDATSPPVRCVERRRDEVVRQARAWLRRAGQWPSRRLTGGSRPLVRALWRDVAHEWFA